MGHLLDFSKAEAEVLLPPWAPHDAQAGLLEEKSKPSPESLAHAVPSARNALLPSSVWLGLACNGVPWERPFLATPLRVSSSESLFKGSS